MAMTAWGIYEKHEMDLPPGAVQELRQALDAYAAIDLKSLAEACEGCVRFMLLLTEHRDDQVNGKKVLDLLREYADRFEPFWQQVAEALEREGGSKLEAFQKFAGQGKEKKDVAVVGQPPPKGTVPLSTFLNPARPPPWAKKGPGAK